MPASKQHRKAGHRRSRKHAKLLLQLHLESNPEALCLVRATLQRATEIMHFEESESRAIVRSVDEALANVIRHAYKDRTGFPIEVTCRKLFSDGKSKSICGLEVLLSDSGTPVNPKKLQGRPLSQIRPGGLGLHFMKQSMDVVEFRHSHGKNLLRMVKYLPSPVGKETPQGE